MNRKVTHRLFLGLCISFGLMACSQELQQNKYEKLIIGLDGDDINLYPLGEEMNFYVYSTGDWDLIYSDEISGISISKGNDRISIEADPFFGEDGRSGSFRIRNDYGSETIRFNQEPVALKVRRGDEVIESGDTLSAAGEKIDFTIETNVNYVVSAVPDTIIVNKDDLAFAVQDTTQASLNGDDVERNITIALCDKDKDILSLYDEYLSFVLRRKAAIFKWTDGDVGKMGEREFEFDFNETDDRTFSFKSSGNWKINEKPQWVKVRNEGMDEITDGNAGDYTLSITVEPNKGEGREGRVSFTHVDYPSRPLKINVIQDKAPAIELSKEKLELVEKQQSDLTVSVEDWDDFEVSWKTEPEVGVVNLSSNEGKTVKVTALSEGTAEVSAVVKINGQEVTTLTCTVTVKREYDGGTGEEIGDDKGEW